MGIFYDTKPWGETDVELLTSDIKACPAWKPLSHLADEIVGKFEGRTTLGVYAKILQISRENDLRGKAVRVPKLF